MMYSQYLKYMKVIILINNQKMYDIESIEHKIMYKSKHKIKKKP